MALVQENLSDNVCVPCRNRKKRCDKKLPACGPCRKRNLICSFEDPVDSESLTRPQGWRYIQGPSGCLEISHGYNFETNYGFQRTPTADRGSGSLESKDEVSLGEDLKVQILRAIGITGRSALQIRDDYFQGIHRWLPIVAPWRMSAAKLNLERKVLDIDSLILLLAMSVYTQPPPSDKRLRRNLWGSSEYLTTKLFFAQAQGMLTASLPLIQAGILIATYELGARQPQIAFMTIRTCTGMCDLLGVGRQCVEDASRPSGADVALRAVESCNVARGLAIMDRVITLEASEYTQQSLEDFPSSFWQIPHHFEHHPPVDQEILTAVSFDPALGFAMRSYLGAGFERQAQAVLILDRILGQLRAPCCVEDKTKSLHGLDHQLQAFLAVAMENYKLPGHHCGAIAVGIRTLLLLHHYILAIQDSSPNPKDVSDTGEAAGARSRVALHSAARMMAAVAASHMKDVDNIDILPLTAAYNAQIAIRQLKSLDADVRDDSTKADLEALQVMDDAFWWRWVRTDSFNSPPES